MPRSRLPLEVSGNARQLLGMSPARFLRDYWQKRPLLIRNAFPDFTPPLMPDDLAGLACVDGALARIVMHSRGKAKALDSRFRGNDGKWMVSTGPFDDETFAQLPESHWTLLVQDVDKWDADTAALLRPFAFIPSWRIDDVMISYATDAGGVGAHVDQYDVFLLQGLGRRRWAIDTRPNPPTGFRDNVELKLLQTFSATHEWVLEPGDMLYLPPGIPHDGIAVGECMTFSIGMRAPAASEMLVDFAHSLAEFLPEEERYCDPDLKPAKLYGEIDASALRRARETLGSVADVMHGDALADWFGRYITRYRSALVPAPRKRKIDAATLAARLEHSIALRDPWTRLAWRHRGRDAVLYASGEAFPAPPAGACVLAGAARTIDGTVLLRLPARARGLRLLKALLDAGHLHLQRR